MKNIFRNFQLIALAIMTTIFVSCGEEDNGDEGIEEVVAVLSTP